MKKLLIGTWILAFLLCSCALEAPAEPALNASAPAAKTAASSTEPLNFEQSYQMGLDLAEEEKWTEARDAFAAATELDPGQASAWTELGKARVKAEQNQKSYQAAKEDFEKALALDDTLADAHLGLADALIRMEDFDAATAALEAAVLLTDDAEVAEKLAMMQDGDIFNSSGDRYFETGYDNGKRIWYHVYHYYDDGLGYSITAYNNAGQEICFAECLYNSEGKAIQTITKYVDTGLLTQITREYDEQGNMIRSDGYDEKGNHTGYTLYTYDEAGNKVRTDDYDPNDVCTSYHVYVYNDQGVQTELYSYSGTGELTGHQIKIFDDQGRYTGIEAYDGNGKLTSRWVYTYNSEGQNMSLTIYDGNGKVISHTEYKN